MPVVEPRFRISSYCHSHGCVAVALTPEDVSVRSSAVVDSPVLSFGSGSWNRFVDGLQGGAAERPAAVTGA